MTATPSLMLALRNRFPAPAWAFLEQVRSCTGYVRATRYADALVMSLYPSRGLELHGIEVKVSRNDWLRELKKPEKADAIAPFCDRWWIAAPGDNIVHAEELPPTWGLLVQQKTRIVAKVEAPKLDAKPMDRELLAAILRNVNVNYVPESRVNEMAVERLERLQQAHGDALLAAQRGADHELSSLKQSLETFERVSGVHISRWDGRNIGEAVKLALEERALTGRLQHARRVLSECQKHIDDVLGTAPGTGGDK